MPQNHLHQLLTPLLHHDVTPQSLVRGWESESGPSPVGATVPAAASECRPSATSRSSQPSFPLEMAVRRWGWKQTLTFSYSYSYSYSSSSSSSSSFFFIIINIFLFPPSPPPPPPPPRLHHHCHCHRRPYLFLCIALLLLSSFIPLQLHAQTPTPLSASASCSSSSPFPPFAAILLPYSAADAAGAVADGVVGCASFPSPFSCYSCHGPRPLTRSLVCLPAANWELLTPQQSHHPRG